MNVSRQFRLSLLALLVVILAGCSSELIAQDGDTTTSDTGGADTTTSDTGGADTSDIDTSAASAVLEQLIVDSGGFAEFAECPFDPLGSLLREAIADVGSQDVIRALRGDIWYELSSWNDDPEGAEDYVSCSRFNDDAEGFGLTIAPRPDDLNQYLDALLGDDADSYRINRLDAQDHRGGQLERLCAQDLVDDQYSFCEVHWLNDDLLVTLFVSGPATTTADIATMESGLTTVLSELVANLAEASL